MISTRPRSQVAVKAFRGRLLYEVLQKWSPRSPLWTPRWCAAAAATTGPCTGSTCVRRTRSTFATVLLRTKATRCQDRQWPGAAMAYELIDAVWARWRAVNTWHLAPSWWGRLGSSHKGKLIEQTADTTLRNRRQTVVSRPERRSAEPTRSAGRGNFLITARTVVAGSER